MEFEITVHFRFGSGLSAFYLLFPLDEVGERYCVAYFWERRVGSEYRL